MNTNFQITIETFKSLHGPIQPLQQSCLFTKLFKSKDNKVIKKKVFETKKDWLTWRNSITQELLNQRILSSKYPGKVLTILNYTVETINHQRDLYITYDCENDVQPLFQYLNNNTVSFQEQTHIFEQLLQITCILFKSQFEHTNLKPNNILYNKKQVLITDFGSARTHYQNFLKEYPSGAKKEWQNNLIFFYPQEYQKIMVDDNLDFRNEAWSKFDISNQKFRKDIDIWALSMMMIQVFENNQTLPDKLTNYYGLNNNMLLKKIENLKQYSNGIFSQIIYSLLIDKKDPEQVYQTFLQQKQGVQTVSLQMESTFTIKQIFDYLNDDDNIIKSYKPENYFLGNQAIEDLQDQFDNDDASSVISSNQQTDIASLIEVKSKKNLTLIPNQLPQNHNQTSPSRKKPESQKYEFSQNQPQFFNIQDNTSNQNNQNQKKPSIVVTNYEINEQQIEEVHLEDTQIDNINQALLPIQSQMQLLTSTTDQQNPRNLKEFQDLKEIKQTILNKTNNDDNLKIGCLQSFQLNKIDDNELNEIPNNQSPIFNQNQSQAFQFFDIEKLITVNQNDDNDIVSFKNSQNFQFQNSKQQDLLNLEDEQQQTGQLIQIQGQIEKQNQVQQIKIMEIDDFDGQYQKVPTENQVLKEIIQSGHQEGITLQELDDSKKETQNKQQNSSQTNRLIIIPTKGDLIPLTDDPIQNQGGIESKRENNNINITQPQFQLLQPFDDEHYDENQIEGDSVIIGKNLNEDHYSLLIEITENDKQQIDEKNSSKQQQNIINDVNNDKTFQSIRQVEDLEEEIIEQESKKNPITLKVIKNILNEGVIQLQDKDQKETLDQLKMIQKIFTKILQHHIDLSNIYEDEQDKNNEKQIQQLEDEIVLLKQNEQLQLIEDINDGINFIQKKQEADNIFDDNKMENNLLLLTYLNEDQLKLLKSKLQNKKIIHDKIKKIIEVKDDLKKFKQNPNLQNLLKQQQIDLLNKEELKIYQQLLEKMAKEKKQVDRLIIQQNVVNLKLKEIKKKEDEEINNQKFIDFLRNPCFDKLLPNDYLRKLNNEDGKQYQAALRDLQLKSTQRQKNYIQEQIDIIDEIRKKSQKKKPHIKKIDEVSDDEGSTKQSSKNNNQLNFQDAYLKTINKLADENDTDLLSLNQYIREFQLNSITYQITDQVPLDCQKIQSSSKNRKIQLFDFQGSKYKGETLYDQPHGIGILRMRGVSSIYKGYFKEGKFYWGQVVEMNDQGLLTQYVGYYNQESQVKHGKARLKWYQPIKIGFCGSSYDFNQYEIYEGSFVLGYIHGKGKKIYSDQSEYEGEWKKNKREGQGRLTLKQGGKKSITYEGQFQDDVQHGKKIIAIHHHQTGLDLIVEGEYHKGKPIGQHLLIFNQIVQREIIY